MPSCGDLYAPSITKSFTMIEPPAHSRYSLRQLPFPAKIVLTVFLLTVGLGYISAMIQLHMKHSNMEGDALPSPADVVIRFSHYQEFDGVFPNSKLQDIISGDRENGWSTSNMTPAFFVKSGGYEKDVAARGQEVVDNEREGERLAMIAWINLPAEAQKKCFDEDSMPLPEELQGKPITNDYLDNGNVLIGSIIGDRCAKCHEGNDRPENFNEYDVLASFTKKPETKVETALGKEWVKSSKTMSVEHLTQSTHAHLLSFAMLYALTGLIFAFTSYPVIVRVVLAPIVLLAQVADIFCWWLARLELPYGPLFATAIIGTGAVVGIGLMLQILGSVFNMYTNRGKMVLFPLFVLAAFGGWTGYSLIVKPALEEERVKATTKTVKPAQAEEPAKKVD